MGLLLSVIISYAGVNEAIETLRHILSGILPDTDPDFQDLVDHYSRLLQKTANHSTAADWTVGCGQGYLCLTEDDDGKLKSVAVKYYDGQPDSTAILFSTKISSFGQDSVEDNSSQSQANGDYRSERYLPTLPTKTKTIITNTSDSFSVGYRDRSPTSVTTSVENISDPNRISANSFERDEGDLERNEAKEKLTWHYRPKSPTPQAQTLPEIHFQSFDDDQKGVYSEDFLRSRSRENSRERRNETWSTDASVDSAPDEDTTDKKPKMKDLPKLDSFEEEKDVNQEKEVIEEEDLDDFWGNSGD
ncbi:uncharacterized protein LOC135071261 isoform X2 [Ostrinia nubilalis]|uniref:uncharacterized protein LOC135071261 isoform X2 n=1 Tax=Ostrinia nubilalis TaxID=29057 RepID=UPI0030826B6F